MKATSTQKITSIDEKNKLATNATFTEKSLIAIWKINWPQRQPPKKCICHDMIMDSLTKTFPHNPFRSCHMLLKIIYIKS